MRVKLFSRAFLSKIGALVLLLSLFFVPLVVQSTSAAFTSSATAKTTVASYTSWDPSNLSVVAEPKEEVSTVKNFMSGHTNQISLSYDLALKFVVGWKEPEYISPGSNTYYFTIKNASGGIVHSAHIPGGSPFANASVDLSTSNLAYSMPTGASYTLSVRNSLINGSYINKDFQVAEVPSTASDHIVVLDGGSGLRAGTKITITAPPGATITNVTWPRHSTNASWGTREVNTSTKKVWSLPHMMTCNPTLYSNIQEMRYRFRMSNGQYGPYNAIRIYNCGVSM